MGYSVIITSINKSFSRFISLFCEQKVGTLARGVPVRAIEKIADFLLLEGDDDDEGNSGPLGWADASCLTPTSFPAFYEFASDLPEGVKLLFVVLRVTKTIFGFFSDPFCMSW